MNILNKSDLEYYVVVVIYCVVCILLGGVVTIA
jgi:hypothetical protein